MRSAVVCWTLLLPLAAKCHTRVGEETVGLSYDDLLDTIASLQHENQQIRDRPEAGCAACSNLSHPIPVSARGSASATSRRLQFPSVNRGCIGYRKWGAISFTKQVQVDDFANRSCEELFTKEEPGRVVVGGLVHDLTALRSWKRIHGDLNIQNTVRLKSVEGFENLSFVSGELLILKNRILTDVSALHGVRAVKSIDVTENEQLAALEGLHSIEEVVTSVAIRNNSRLENLTGLASLRSIGGDLVIMNNTALKSLLGLGKLGTVGRVQVLSNLNMQYLGGPFCQNTDVRLKSLQFHGEGEDPCDPDKDPLDAFPRCVTPGEWQSLSSLALRHASAQGARLTPENWNCAARQRRCTDLDHWRKSRGTGTGKCKEGPACGPDPVKCLWKQPCRIHLTDLDVSYRGTVFCPSCGCGSCGENETTEVVGNDGLVDLQALLQDKAPGSYTLCRCGDELGPLMPIELQGAKRIGQTLCIMGVLCSIEAEFDADAFKNSKIWLVPESTGCGNARDGPNISGAYSDDGSVTFSAEHLSQLMWPGDYELCWRPNGNGYEARTITTAVKIHGPFTMGSEDEHDSGKPHLNIRYEGLGFSNEFRKTGQVKDIMRLVPVRADQVPPDICGVAALYEAGGSVNGTFNFRFGTSAINPGMFVKCWCYNESSSCVNTGRLRVVCPAGTVEAPFPGGGCEPCPVGKKFKKLDAGGECVLHGEYWWLLGVQHLSLFWIFFLLLVQLGMPIRIQDTFTNSGELCAETAYPHWCHCYGRRSFPVLFTSTTHPNLDTPQAPLRARPITVQSLRILAENGQPISKCWDTSRGFVQLPLWQALWHKGWPLPAAVLLLFNFAFYIGLLILRVNQEQVDAPSLLSGASGALGLALALRVLSRWYSRSERLTELDRHVNSFREKLRRKNPKPAACAKGPGRAVALSELFDMWEHFQAYIRERNAYYLDTNILGPLTKPYQLSYAEVAGPAMVRFYVSHYWGNSFQDFCKTLKKHAETVCARALTSMTQEDDLWKQEKYWICFLSNNQYCLDEELGTNWDQSSFFLTLQSGHCKGVCLVLDTLAAPLTRAWCIFELLQTLILEEKTGITRDCGQVDGFMGLLLCTEGGVLNEGQGSADVTINLVERICRLDLEKAEASIAQDKEMIHKQVVDTLGSFKKMNVMVRQKFDDLLKRVKSQQDSSFSNIYQVLRAALQEDGVSDGETSASSGRDSVVAGALECMDGTSACADVNFSWTL